MLIGAHHKLKSATDYLHRSAADGEISVTALKLSTSRLHVAEQGQTTGPFRQLRNPAFARLDKRQLTVLKID